MAVISMNLSSGCLRMKTDVMVILPFYSPYDIADGKRDEIFPVGKKYQVLWLLNGGNGNDWDSCESSGRCRILAGRVE